MKTSRVAVVTGAARGIGAAIAVRLAEDGCAVALLDMEQAAAEAVADGIRAGGGRALAVRTDVGDEASCEAAVAAVAAELGAPTILVNNAGITRDNLVFKMALQDWDEVMRVNLRGAFLMTQLAQAHMTQERFGRIVNISSTSAIGNRGQANYAAAKAGIIGFTKTLSIELGKFGITANAVAPGYIETEMTSATATRLGISADELFGQWASQIPVGRTGLPEDIAHTVSFLSDERSGFVSGQVVYVAGGPVA